MPGMCAGTALPVVCCGSSRGAISDERIAPGSWRASILGGRICGLECRGRWCLVSRNLWRNVVCERTTVSTSDYGGDSRWNSSSQQSRSHHQVSSALSTLPIAHPSQDAEPTSAWRLDDVIVELRGLQRQLLACKSVRAKMTVIERSKRVSRVFGGFDCHGLYVNPVVALAMRVLSEDELYLLKCLVASGQEHVLECSYSAIDDAEEQNDELLNVPRAVPASPLKEAFMLLGNAVDSCGETSSNLLNGFSALFSTSIPKVEKFQSSEPTISIPSRGNEVDMKGNGIASALKKLVTMLDRLEKFYDSIGGIVGYQVTSLELIKSSETGEIKNSSDGASLSTSSKKKFSVPLGPDLARNKTYAVEASSWGIEGLPEMGEIYPLGGAGDRLGLCDDITGECLPVAMLPYSGRSLLEGLIRDLQAREFLYYKVHGKQHITPVAIMTSSAKKNNQRVEELCGKLGWFGRGKHNFKLFEQPLVPMVAVANGQWLVSETLTAVLKPGGHGVIWKLANDEGIFNWFYRKGRRAAIVRQISNTVAGTDHTLLALSGIGLRHNKKFGFASCERNVGTAEGVNVLMEKSLRDGTSECAVTCIEYTEFEKLGINDIPITRGSMQASYPANTNVLYVDLASVEQVVRSGTVASLPGMIMNLKKPLIYKDNHGLKHSVQAGRIECTMQNIADSLVTKCLPSFSSKDHEENLDTFVIYNQRRKVTSSAKRRRRAGEHSLHQTPDGAFLDAMRNAHDLLTSCGIFMPKMESNGSCVDLGPPFLVFMHPALGPLWDIVRQKIRGGSVAAGSELLLEIAELSWKHVQLDGSMLIQATNIMGSLECTSHIDPLLKYGIGCSKCRLNNVRVTNRGVDWDCPDNIYWQHKVRRHECLDIILEGNAEFEATNVTFEGSHSFFVPSSHRMIVTNTSSGLSCVLKPLPTDGSRGTWFWQYDLQYGGYVELLMVDNEPC